MLLCTAKFRNITPFSNHLSACKFLNTAENFRFDLSRERKGLKDFPIHWIKNSTLILGVSLFHLCFVLFFFCISNNYNDCISFPNSNCI